MGQCGLMDEDGSGLYCHRRGCSRCYSLPIHQEKGGPQCMVWIAKIGILYTLLHHFFITEEYNQWSHTLLLCKNCTIINNSLHKTFMMHRIVYTKLSSSLLSQYGQCMVWIAACCICVRVGLRLGCYRRHLCKRHGNEACIYILDFLLRNVLLLRCLQMFLQTFLQ